MSPLPGSPAGPPCRGMPTFRVLYISFWILSKEASPSVSLNRAPTERDAPFLEPSFNYFSKFPVNRHPPPRFPNGAPMKRERHPFPGPPSSSHPLIIHLFLKVPGKVAPSMFTQQGPYGERCSISEPTVYLFIYICQSQPFKEHSHKMGVKHTVTVHEAPCRQKAYIQWGAAWSPKGITYNTAITTPVPCSFQHDTFHLGFGRTVPSYPACIVVTLNRVSPAHLLPPPT